MNSILLVYAALSIIWEALERVMDPPDISTESLLMVSIGGLIVNLVGIFAFEHGGHGHSHGGGGGHGHSHGGGSHGHSHSHGSEKNSHNHSHSHSDFSNNHGHSHSHGNSSTTLIENKPEG